MRRWTACEVTLGASREGGYMFQVTSVLIDAQTFWVPLVLMLFL